MLMSKIGNKNFTLLSRMMDLHGAKHRVISQNVANVNTPNYQRREFKFDRSLRLAMDKGSASDYRRIEGWVDRPKNTAVRNNGNNVDIDLEMMNLKENSSAYELYTQIYSRKATAIKQAIRGVR